jgi:hypothetical protein
MRGGTRPAQRTDCEVIDPFAAVSHGLMLALQAGLVWRGHRITLPIEDSAALAYTALPRACVDRGEPRQGFSPTNEHLRLSTPWFEAVGPSVAR